MNTEYPKIETLYERDARTFRVTSQLRCPEFGLVDRWLVTEKIDGCLHYSQLVATDRGPLQVGRIVNQRLPVLVASYNLDAGVVGWIDRAGRIYRSIRFEPGRGYNVAREGIQMREVGRVGR